MKGKVSALAVAFAGLALFCAYSLREPLPDGICEPRIKVYLILALGKISHGLSILGNLLGFGDYLVISRSLMAGFGRYRIDRDDPDQPQIELLLIEGVQVKKYTPKVTVSLSVPNPAIVYLHGGGWIMGDADMYEPSTRELAKRTNCTIFFVEYRLAPENPFPIPFEDCLKVTQHLLSADNAKQHNIDNKRIAVMGDSAGGNLAAAVSLKLRQESAKPKLQLLIYPVLQAFDFRTPSYQLETTPLLYPDSMAMLWLLYMNYTMEDAIGKVPQLIDNNHTSAKFKRSQFPRFFDVEMIKKNYAVSSNYQQSNDDFGDELLFKELSKRGLMNPFAAPLLAETMTGMPPAFVLSAEFDVLRDDAVAYVQRLRKHDIPVEHYNSANGFHGVLMMTKSDRLYLECSGEAWDAVVHYLKEKL